MANLGRKWVVGTVVAAAISTVSVAFTALPAGAAPPPKKGLDVVDLLQGLRGPTTTAPKAKAPRRPAPTVTPAPAPTTTTTTAPAGKLSGTLREGSKGAQVRALEVRLDNLHYFVGPIDQTYDDQTAQAVMAFQKVNRLDRSGEVDQAVWNAISSAKDPAPLVPGGAAHRVEVDLGRQVLFLYEGAKLSKILAVSTGNGEDYCEGGSCGTAITPVGDFAIYRQGSGWEYGPLGGLYNPQYFKGGYAIHGSKSVPPEPASHGCVRIPMGPAEWFPDHVSNGTPVHIR